MGEISNSSAVEGEATSEPPKDRLTVVETVYHRPFGQEATSIDSRFNRELQTNEQLYQRRFKATEEWEPLDCGWVEEAGMLILVNHEGQTLQTNPSDEEREATAKKIVELSYDHVDMSEYDYCTWLVPPGESMRGYPAEVKDLRVRCRSGVAWCTLYLIPV